jgi:hypothetical protein
VNGSGDTSEVQLLLFANAQLPALSMLIAADYLFVIFKLF